MTPVIQHASLLRGWLGLALFFAGFGLRSAEFVAFQHTNAAGTVMPYRLLSPAAPQAGTRYPVVLFFHGAGERGTNNSAQLVHGTKRFLQPDALAKHPCYVLAPQCPEGQQWVDMPWGADSGVQPEQPSHAMAQALEILDHVQRQNPTDPDRLYVTGLSMGGYATWDVITRQPERFAAAAPVCGGGDDARAGRAAGVAVWAFHSDDDNVVKVRRTRGMIEGLRKAGGRPHYFEYFGLGHNSWDAAYREPELLDWMFAQRRGQPDRYALKSAPPVLPAVARLPETDDGLPGTGPIRRYDWFKSLWRQKRLGWSKQVERDQGAVVFLGDSITQGWGSLAKDFPNFKVANRGISGDTSRGVLYRLKEDVIDLNPKAVVLLIGTNDIEEKAAPAVVATNVRLILEGLRGHRADLPVIVCRVMPSSASMRRPSATLQEVNRLVDELLPAFPNAIRCDTWTPFASEAGDARKEEFPDLLHPNAAGYAKFTATLKPLLEKALAGQ